MATIFTAEGLREKGFRVSLQVSQAEIDRAAMDALLCYVGKVSRITVAPDGIILRTPEQDEAAMQIAVILLLQRHAVATRSGGKTKLSPSQSENAYPTQVDFDNANRLLRKVQETDVNAIQGNVSQLVDDIAGIYYRNTLLSL